jgi:hypothetical protein
MKSIQIHTARPTNGGAFRDAGTIVDVGDKADQINAIVAQALVDGGAAAVVKADGGTAKDAGSK